jgi:hypothetical protein
MVPIATQVLLSLLSLGHIPKAPNPSHTLFGYPLGYGIALEASPVFKFEEIEALSL